MPVFWERRRLQPGEGGFDSHSALRRGDDHRPRVRRAVPCARPRPLFVPPAGGACFRGETDHHAGLRNPSSRFESWRKRRRSLRGDPPSRTAAGRGRPTPLIRAAARVRVSPQPCGASRLGTTPPSRGGRAGFDSLAPYRGRRPGADLRGSSRSVCEPEPPSPGGDDAVRGGSALEWRNGRRSVLKPRGPRACRFDSCLQHRSRERAHRSWRVVHLGMQPRCLRGETGSIPVRVADGFGRPCTGVAERYT